MEAALISRNSRATSIMLIVSQLLLTDVYNVPHKAINLRVIINNKVHAQCCVILSYRCEKTCNENADESGVTQSENKHRL
jgi:hypothetical protein